jgi:hypothetical protein
MDQMRYCNNNKPAGQLWAHLAPDCCCDAYLHLTQTAIPGNAPQMHDSAMSTQYQGLKVCEAHFIERLHCYVL